MAYTIEIKNLDKIVDEFKNAPAVIDVSLQRTVKNAGGLILGTEKKEAPVRTGLLRKNITMEYTPIITRVYPKQNYAAFVNYGTGLYGSRRDFIRPKRAKFLRFKINGKVIYTKRTRGQKANPFVERTKNAVEPKLNKMFDDFLDDIIKKI